MTTLTLGGLNGNKNFASSGGVFATTGGGYTAVTALTLNPGSGTASYSGVIADGASGTTLTKTGAGTLNFGVSSGLTGLGALAANNGTTNVNSVLGTGGTSTVNVTGATTLKFGSVSQTLSSLTIGAGSTVTFTSGLASFSGGGGKVARLGGSAVVPEPGTLGLLLVGALGMLNRRRRQA